MVTRMYVTLRVPCHNIIRVENMLRPAVVWHNNTSYSKEIKQFL